VADSTISILVRDKDHPCAPYSGVHQFAVDILNCDGTYLTWKGVTYRGYRLRERIHDQIKVPPGCYIIRGHSMVPCTNIECELAMVVVGCDETICVCLLPTGVFTCTIRLRPALQLALEVPEIRKAERQVTAAIKALDDVAKYLPKDVFPPPREEKKE